MYPCFKCKNNIWNYKYRDETGMVEATCKRCFNVVSFPSKRKRKIDAGIQIGSGISVEFRSMDGILYRKEEDGNYYKISIIEEKGGIRIATIYNNQKKLSTPDLLTYYKT